MKGIVLGVLSLAVLAAASIANSAAAVPEIGLSVHAIRPGVTCPVSPDAGFYKLDRWHVAGSMDYARYGQAQSDQAALSDAFAEWAGPTGIAFNGAAGTGTAAVELNGENAIFFDSLSNRTIAVTYVWFNRFTKEVVEFDMVFNSSLSWDNLSGSGDCVESSAFDVENIAVHEIGHIYGIAHTSPNGANNAQSLYPYAREGEIYKRSLASGDLAGIAAKYGGN